MLVWLIGMMGAGKTTIGRHLAARTGAKFIDIDELVAQDAESSIAEIFAREGEGGFRRREAEAISAVAREDRAVVAVGGGAILSSANVTAMRNTGTVIWLRASIESLVARLGNSDGRPLLEGGDHAVTLAKIYGERRSKYEAAASWTIDTDDLAPEQVVSLIEAKWTR